MKATEQENSQRREGMTVCASTGVTKRSAGRVRLSRSPRSVRDLIKCAPVVVAAMFLAAAWLTGVNEVSARPAPPARGERALRAIETVRLRRLMVALRASEEQKRIIRETYKRGLQRKHALLRERAELLRKMQGLVLAGDLVDTHNRELATRELTLRFRQIEREIAEARWTTEERILEHLTPPQRVRYILFNERFEKELRERIEALKRARQRPTPPAQPAPPAEVLE